MVKSFIKNYFTFKFHGRSSRQEYFTFRLINTFLNMIFLYIPIFFISIDLNRYYNESLSIDLNRYYNESLNQDMFITYDSSIFSILSLVLLGTYLIHKIITFFSFISLTVRRLHDLNKSGWWYLIAFIPRILLVMTIFLFVLGIIIGINNMFTAISQADNISPDLVAGGISNTICCPPNYFFHMGIVEGFMDGGFKMYLCILFYPLLIIYFITNSLLVVFLASKSKTKVNSFGSIDFQHKDRYELNYLLSLYPEIVSLLFLTYFIFMHWTVLINGLGTIAMANEIPIDALKPLFDLFYSNYITVFYYMTIFFIVCSTFIVLSYFRLSKKESKQHV